MQKHKRYFVPALIFFFVFCSYPLASCKDSADDNVSTHNPDTPSPVTPSKRTLIEFKNTEEFPVRIYSDSLRNNVFAEIAANNTKTVSSNISSTTVTAFYPTFSLLYPIGTPVISTVSIPYNGPSFVHTIEANKTTTVPIPKLESIYINSSYLLIINKSNHSLALSEGGTNEKAPLNGGSTVINSGLNAAYEIRPGAVSAYSVLRNGSAPVAFPDDLSEFKAGIIYALTYNGTALTVTSQDSILQKIPPSTPVNVKVEGMSTNSVQITWDAVYGATSYRIYRASGSATASYSQIANITTLSWTDTGLTSGAIYYYKVSAVSGVNMVSEQSEAVAAIMPPTNLQVTTVTATSVTLGWNAFSGASGYNVYRSTSENGIYTKINSVLISGTAFTDTGLSYGMGYYYKVSAILDVVESLQSDSVSAATLSSVPNVRVNAISNISVSLKWDIVSEESNYNVYRSANENGTYTKINSAAIRSTEFTDTSVIAYTAYWYKVSAIIGGIEGLESLPISVNTGVIVPGGGLAGKLAWLQNNAKSNTLYEISVDANENISPQTLSYNGKSGIVIVLSGSGEMKTVTLSANGALFSVSSGVTLILDNNITLKGKSDNNTSLVEIADGGAMIMNTGAIITGNTNHTNSHYNTDSAYGGGVYVGGLFTMNGGEISSNTCSSSSSSSTFSANSYGGGVYVSGTFTMNGGTISNNTCLSSSSNGGYASSRGGGVSVRGTFTLNGGEISDNKNSSASSGYGSSSSSLGGGVYSERGTFRMGGGVIYGNNAASGLKNTASIGAALYNSGTAQYGTFTGDTFYSSGNLTTTDTTIRVVNGNLLTE